MILWYHFSNQIKVIVNSLFSWKEGYLGFKKISLKNEHWSWYIWRAMFFLCIFFAGGSATPWKTCSLADISIPLSPLEEGATHADTRKQYGSVPGAILYNLPEPGPAIFLCLTISWKFVWSQIQKLRISNSQTRFPTGIWYSLQSWYLWPPLISEAWT